MLLILTPFSATWTARVPLLPGIRVFHVTYESIYYVTQAAESVSQPHKEPRYDGLVTLVRVLLGGVWLCRNNLFPITYSKLLESVSCRMARGDGPRVRNRTWRICARGLYNGAPGQTTEITSEPYG